MSDTLEIRHFPLRKALVVRMQVMNKDFGAAARQGFGIVHEFIRSHQDIKRELSKESECMAASPDDPSQDGPIFYEPGFFLAADADIGKVTKAIEGTQLLIKDFEEGEWAVYVLKGPYDQLAGAYKRAFALIPQQGKTENWSLGDCYEAYLNDHSKVPADELLTEIVIPVRDA